ncbi:MAG: thioredoxin [Deltaproteobacteria bacterium HGW-Deltaproteobacteria-14]|nr:MAG: thioredoxin [Deltaproteobacteria bacterium HGW-Deltaproteobacteria-14]
MMLRLTAVLSAAMLIVACGKKDEKTPEGAQVAPAAASAEGANARGAGDQAPPTAEKPEVGAAGDAAATGQLTPPSTNAPNAMVEIIEFSDYQCPFCSRVEPTIAQIKKEYGEKVKVTFMQNPLSFHKDARPASKATIAAMKQGKFWEMHDKLFANQKALKPEDLERYAQELGLNMEQFKKDSADPAADKFIDQNQAIATALGATGTPSFFINGKNLRGAQPFEQFKAIIDAEIAEAEKAQKSGADWVKERSKANNQPLYDYVYAGKTPPKAAPRPERPVDRTVYKVDVDPQVDPIKGNPDALVTLVVFSEFQCPFCSKVRPALDQVMADYGDKVRMVFKSNPLPFHKNAQPACEAALCAKDQGKFWEMHDKLFDNQRALESADLEKYAGELGLDMTKFKSCASTGKYKQQILADQELAGKVTARGTPNTFINGRKLTGAKPIEEFKSVVDEEIKKAEALAAAKGLKGQALYTEIIKNGKVFEPLEEKANEFKLGPMTPIKGKKDAKVQITIFSDFQCPFCSRVAAPLTEVEKHYGDDLSVVFKHFPLSFHKDAMPAALAGQCAQEQGKFWEMHDQMFGNQKALSPDDLKGYAKAIGLDEAKFAACFESAKHKTDIEADMAEGREAGVRGTPTLYINGRKFNSPSGYNLEAFTTVIDKYILKK